jgi:hypothetical protein
MKGITNCHDYREGIKGSHMKKMNALSNLCKQMKRNLYCFWAPCIDLAPILNPELGIPSSSSTFIFKMLKILGNKTFLCILV